MKFNIIKAEMRPLGKYDQMVLNLTIVEDDMFAIEHHEIELFPVGQQIQMWEEAIKTGIYPEYNASYRIVKNLPPFKVIDENTGIRSTRVFNSLRILVKLDNDGQLCQDPKTAALEFIDNCCEAITD